jgi:hypothetical protein
MFEPTFDPYDEITILKHNVAELIKAVNHSNQNLKELAHQHEVISKHLVNQANRISTLEIQLYGRNLRSNDQ